METIIMNNKSAEKLEIYTSEKIENINLSYNNNKPETNWGH